MPRKKLISHFWHQRLLCSGCKACDNKLRPFDLHIAARHLIESLCCADDELEIRTLVSFHGKANVQYILDITPLNEVLFALLR